MQIISIEFINIFVFEIGLENNQVSLFQNLHKFMVIKKDPLGSQCSAYHRLCVQAFEQDSDLEVMVEKIDCCFTVYLWNVTCRPGLTIELFTKICACNTLLCFISVKIVFSSFILKIHL